MSRYAQRHRYSISDDTAYLVGLIASDGCLYKDERHINLTSKDIELLNYLNKILDKNYKISAKIGGFGTSAHQINFSNTDFYDFLLRMGIRSAKSKTIERLEIPQPYYHHFLRGYFDGDGSLYGYRDIRWKHSFMYYINFASASKRFLLWIQQCNSDYLGVSSGTIKLGKQVYVLSYAKRDSYVLLNKMYENNPQYKLSRKYKRWIDYLNTDSYSKM